MLYINNHVKIILHYMNLTNSIRIVGFNVIPYRFISIFIFMFFFSYNLDT